MNRTGHGNCRKIDAQPSPGQDGTRSILKTTEITRKPKKVDNVSLDFFKNFPDFCCT